MKYVGWDSNQEFDERVDLRPELHQERSVQVLNLALLLRLGEFCYFFPY